MRTLILTGVLWVAATASAQAPEPVGCRIVAAQATQTLSGAALGEVPATADEKRVFGEFQRGVAEECTNADGEGCYSRKPGETALIPTNCPADPVKGWMATSARQIMPTQVRQNRATQALQGLLGKPAAPAPVAAAPVAPAPATPAAEAPMSPPPPPPPTPAASAAEAAPPGLPPPPPPPLSKDEQHRTEDTPELETDDLLTFPLAGMSRRELKYTATLLEDKKPSMGLVFGMYGGGAGAIAAGSFFLAVSVSAYGVSGFGVLLGVVALTAGVAMAIIGTIALVSRLRTRAAYNARLDEIQTLLRRPGKPPSSVELFQAPALMTVAQW